MAKNNTKNQENFNKKDNNETKDKKNIDQNLKEILGEEYSKSMKVVEDTNEALDLLFAIYNPKNIIGKIDAKIAKKAIENDILPNFKRAVTVSNLTPNALF